MKRTTITLPDDLAELVEFEARRRDSSVSEVIREAVASALTGKRRRLPFAALCDDPGMVRGSSIDDGLGSWGDDIDRDRR